MNPINIDKVKQIVDSLTQAEVIDSISETIDNKFGYVEVKVTVQNGSIWRIAVTKNKVHEFDKKR